MASGVPASSLHSAPSAGAAPEVQFVNSGVGLRNIIIYYCNIYYGAVRQYTVLYIILYIVWYTG